MIKKFKVGTKVVCLEGYTFYGPPHLKQDKVYTVLKVDSVFVYLKEIYAGRYGFYHKRFDSLK